MADAFRAAATADNVEDLTALVYDVAFKKKSLGFTDEDTMEVEIGGRYITKGVDQIAAEIVKAQFQGHTVKVRMTLSGADLTFVGQTVLDGAITPILSEDGIAFGLGDYGISDSAFTGELNIIPSSNEVTDFSNSFLLNRAYVDLNESALIFKGSKNEFQNLPLVFNVLPDLNQQREARLGIFGDIKAKGDVLPEGLIVTAGDVASPYKSMSSMTLAVSGKADVEAWGIFSTDSTLTGAINDAGGLTADETDTALTYDGYTGAQLVAGNIIKIGTELCYVVSATTTTAVLVRAIMGTTVAVHADDAVLTVQENIRILRLTEFVDWTSDTPAQVTVGNKRGQVDDTKKGRCAWVSVGTDADIKATFTDINAATFDSNEVKVNAA